MYLDLSLIGLMFWGNILGFVYLAFYTYSQFKKSLNLETSFEYTLIPVFNAIVAIIWAFVLVGLWAKLYGAP